MIKWTVLIFIEFFACWYGFFSMNISLHKLLGAWPAIAALVIPLFVILWLIFDLLLADAEKEQKEKAAKEIEQINDVKQAIIDDLKFQNNEQLQEISAQKNEIETLAERSRELEKTLENQKQISKRFAKKIEKLAVGKTIASLN